MKSTDIGRASDLLLELSKIDQLDLVLAHEGATRVSVRNNSGSAEVLYENKTLKTVLLKTAAAWRIKVEAELASLGVELDGEVEENAS